MAYGILKALHVVAFVSWFAALLYGVRLFIYHVEAIEGVAAERLTLHRQFTVMERRLWLGIGLPASILTVGLGLALAFLTDAWAQPWFHWKMLGVVGLLGYHHVCGRLRKRLAKSEVPWSSRSLRIFNEVGTLFLVLIAFLAVTKSPSQAGVAGAVFLVLGVLAFRGRKGK
ncbi:MAG TPA: CopD family protein [Bdellovibrionota bacterium]|jgi:putative membrane protein|nr:CopD family protein [Bdellovibrionota bacterium]